MKPFNKIISKLLFFASCISIVFLACNKSKDPYDEGFPAAKWAPVDLSAEVGDNSVLLTWEQMVETIDGFIIERSPDSLNWEFLSKKMIDSSLREYLDTTITTGKVYFYRIYAKAGTNMSDYCYSDVVIVPLQLPSVITSDVTGIESSSVTLNGAVTKDGGKTVTERGFCYSLNSLPTVKEKKIAAGSGTGVFTKMADKLTYGTTYYLRAYATNENGTSYGNEKVFKTLATMANVRTTSINNVDSYAATFLGEVVNDGGGTISERGFCYALESIPDINNNKILCGTGEGEFSASVVGLKRGREYQMRAYVINEIGVSYGQAKYFFTKCNCENLYGKFTDSRDGTTYKTISYGNQIWMAENLKYFPYTTSYANWTLSTPCYLSTTTWGVFYNKKAALVACPDGWHLPSIEEWRMLKTYLVENEYNFDGTTEGNKIAKSLAYDRDWLGIADSKKGDVAFNQSQNNSSCFSAKAGTLLNVSIHYRDCEGTTSYWWTNSNVDGNDNIIGLSSYSPSLIESYLTTRIDGLYVRCVKD